MQTLNMPIDFFDAASKIFKHDESDRNYPYKDSKGYWTIGRGRLIGEELTELKISDHIIEELFKEDLATAIREARFVLGNSFFDSLNQPRQLAVVSMLYTLGQNKFLKFEETIDAMKQNDWDEVARRILAAKWSRDVDPKQRPGVGRDDRIAYMFRTGQFHPDYGVKL